MAKDPDVQIKIKDAVIDGIGKRSSKIANLSDDIIHKLEEDIRNYFTEIDNSMWKKRKYIPPKGIAVYTNEVYEILTKKNIDLADGKPLFKY